MKWRGPWVRVAAGTAVAFGVLTLVSGGATLAGVLEMGAVVPLVLWFNFFAGFAYCRRLFSLSADPPQTGPQ
jgi:hypothetical protein